MTANHLPPLRSGIRHRVRSVALALAAGLSLPALQALGYAPGSTSEPALSALALVYAALPCALKLAAAGLLWTYRYHLDRP